MLSVAPAGMLVVPVPDIVPLKLIVPPGEAVVTLAEPASVPSMSMAGAEMLLELKSTRPLMSSRLPTLRTFPVMVTVPLMVDVEVTL